MNLEATYDISLNFVFSSSSGDCLGPQKIKEFVVESELRKVGVKYDAHER